MGLGSFALSAVLTAAVRKLAIAVGFVARPVAGRYHHKVIPLGGGIAIFVTIAAAISGAIAAVKFVGAGQFGWVGELVAVHREGFSGKADELLIVLGCAFVLFLVGLVDDKKHLGAGLKFLAQFAVAITAARFADIRVELFIESKLITSLLSAVWIVLIINVFNFLDNMDGASAGIAVIVSGILFAVAAIGGQIFVGGMSLVLIGALLGFLVFNFPPAKIFMGDAGSMVVGFWIALLTLRTTYYNQEQNGMWYAVFVPLIVLAVPLYDFLSVTFLRISQGKSPFVGDTQHFSHRLKRHGLSDSQTVLTLYLATLCTGLGATVLGHVNAAGAILIFVQTFMILGIIGIFETTSKDKNPKHEYRNTKQI